MKKENIQKNPIFELSTDEKVERFKYSKRFCSTENNNCFQTNSKKKSEG